MENNSKISSFVGNIGQYLAFFCIGLGIISVISSNWQEIIPSVKLAVYFILLTLSTFWIYKAATGSNNHLESAVIFNAVFIMAGLGLLIQIYNIQISYHVVGLIWCFLTLPLIMTSHKKILPLIWIPVFTYSFGIFAAEHFRFLSLYLMSVPVLYVIALNGLTVLIYNILQIYLKKRLPQFLSAYKFWLVFALVIMVAQIDFFPGMFFSSLALQAISYYRDIQVSFPLMFLLSGLFIVSLFFIEWKSKQSRLFSSVLIISYIYATLRFYTPISDNDLWGMVYTLIILLAIGISGYRNKSVRRINTAATLAAIRIFIGYIQVFGSLLMTGIGLIASGLVILIFIYGIKYIRRLSKKTIGA